QILTAGRRVTAPAARAPPRGAHREGRPMSTTIKDRFSHVTETVPATRIPDTARAAADRAGHVVDRAGHVADRAGHAVADASVKAGLGVADATAKAGQGLARAG